MRRNGARALAPALLVGLGWSCGSDDGAPPAEQNCKDFLIGATSGTTVSCGLNIAASGCALASRRGGGSEVTAVSALQGRLG